MSEKIQNFYEPKIVDQPNEYSKDVNDQPNEFMLKTRMQQNGVVSKIEQNGSNEEKVSNVKVSDIIGEDWNVRI